MRQGITGFAVVVSNFTQLDEMGDQGLISGKIVVYNAPFTSYGATSPYRTQVSAIYRDATICSDLSDVRWHSDHSPLLRFLREYIDIHEMRE